MEQYDDAVDDGIYLQVITSDEPESNLSMLPVAQEALIREGVTPESVRVLQANFVLQVLAPLANFTAPWSCQFSLWNRALCAWSCDEIRVLARTLAKRKHIIALDLHMMLVGSLGCLEAFCVNYVTSNDWLWMLDLAYNNIDDDHCFWLTKSLQRNRTLQCLVLSNNHLSAIGIIPLTRVLAINPEFKVLMVADNRLNGPTVEALCCLALSDLRKGSGMTMLDIRHCRFGGSPRAMCALSLMLKSTGTLVNLLLDHNGIMDWGIRLLVLALWHNRSLECLGLRHNRISEAANDVRDVLWCDNVTLRRMLLDGNFISATVMAEIVEVLELNRSLLRTHEGAFRNIHRTSPGTFALVAAEHSRNPTLLFAYVKDCVPLLLHTCNTGGALDISPPAHDRHGNSRSSRKPVAATSLTKDQELSAANNSF